MPVEVRELIIRAIIASPGQAQSRPDRSAQQATSLEKAEIAQECVRQVLNILKKQKER
jgi:hypothetical protein